MGLLTNIYNESKDCYVALKSYRRQLSTNRDRAVRFYNWWEEPYEQLWFYRYAMHNGMLSADKVVNFISVYGKRKVADYISEGPIIFYTGENVHFEQHIQYADNLLSNRRIQLSLGFDYLAHPHYMRFPLWIPYLFDPTLDEKGIRKRCDELRYPKICTRNKFAAMVARYDWGGTRSQIVDALSHIDTISCPSVVHHNDEDLQMIFKDDKKEYLKQFYFNICPENSNSYGYVTEKIFEAIASGCIPIYWGSHNIPEPDILNQDALIKWNMNSDNTDNIRLIEELYAHPDRLREFMCQPRLKPEAEEIVCGMVDQLNQRLKKLVG